MSRLYARVRGTRFPFLALVLVLVVISSGLAAPALAGESSAGESAVLQGNQDPQAGGGAPAAPCQEDPRHRQLDFWVGEWRVVDPQGQQVGINRIKKLHGGCVIEENWSSSSGGTGQSMNFLDPKTGRWQQHWADSRGGVVWYEGEVRDGVMHFAGENILRDGTVRMSRVVLEPLDGGRVHHFIEHSTDGGATWSTYFDGTYIPLGEAVAEAGGGPEAEAATAPQVVPIPPAGEGSAAKPMPAPSSEVAPPASAPASAEPGETPVKAVSVQVPERQVPLAERAQVRMASPMVLEIALGAIDSIPEGYAWSTREVGAYVCEGVTVKRVEVARRMRRGSVELEITLALHGSRYLHQAAAEVELLSGGETVASGRLKEVAVGRSIGLQDPDEGREKSLTLTLERGQFEALFAGGERPSLRVTVTVR